MYGSKLDGGHLNIYLKSLSQILRESRASLRYLW